jgi:uncharacterized BrkB/YihY/UPF0761 family membrane protein
MLTTLFSMKHRNPDNTNIESFTDIHRGMSGILIFISIVLFILGLSTMIAIAIIAYRCNKRENIIVKTLVVLFAIVFSEFSVPYYLIRYVVMGKKCYNTSIINNKNHIKS